MFGNNYFGIVDYLVVSGILVLSLAIGVYYAVKGRKTTSNAELLTGSRKMSALPVAASILVSYLSATTILGYPTEVYSFGSQVVLFTLIGPFTAIAKIYLFVQVLYDLKLTSAYKYLEYRYSKSVMWMGSGIFIIQLLLTNAIVLYTPALALETIMGLPVWISVLGTAVCAIIYTSIGGIKAVVVTDVFQFIMIFIGMSAIVAKSVSIAGGVEKVLEIAGERGRLEIFNWEIDPFMRHNAINIALGKISSSLFFACQQPVVQRYCSLPTFRDAASSIFWSSIFGFFTINLVILTGVTIFAVYADCDPLSSGQITKADQIVPFFVVSEMSYIPGMMGLFAAVVFSAVLSTISSTLNSLAAVTWEDFLAKAPWFKDLGDVGQVRTYKVLSVLYGSIILGFAFYAQHLGSIFQATSTVMNVAVSIQGALFFMGIFMPMINTVGAIVGVAAGIAATGWVSLNSVFLQKRYIFEPKLPMSTDGCSENVWQNFSGNSTIMSDALLPNSDLKWPEKLYSLSYILYPILSVIVTILVALAVSLLTGGRRSANLVKPEYLHPLLRLKPKKSRKLSMENNNNNLEIEINLALGPESQWIEEKEQVPDMEEVVSEKVSRI